MHLPKQSTRVLLHETSECVRRGAPAHGDWIAFYTLTILIYVVLPLIPPIKLATVPLIHFARFLCARIPSQKVPIGD